MLNKVRLLKLADLLEADAANPTGIKFDLSQWAMPSDLSGAGDMGTGYSIDTVTVPVSCNTAGCALGLAAISGVFKDEGFGFKIGEATGWLLPTFNDEVGYDAGRHFFGLDYEQTNHLFDPDFFSDTKGAEAELEVAKRIREVVAEGDD